MILIYTVCIMFLAICVRYYFFHDSIQPSPTLYKKQYIGHARHQGSYPENSLTLYHYLVNTLNYKIVEGDIVFTIDGCPVLNHGKEANVYKKGILYHININKTTFDELTTYSIRPDLNLPITTVEGFVKFGKQNNICVMLDLTFQKYTLSNLKSLYEIVNKYGMKANTIWGDANIFKLALLDRKLICQIGGSWGRKLLIEAKLKSCFCKQIIMSFSYYGGNIESHEKIVRWGHRLGFIMKVATINELEIAERFWYIGTDLINTDILQNYNDKQ